MGAKAAVQQRLTRGEKLPGFGHPLYPEIDPRAVVLLEFVRLPAMLAELAQQAHAATGLQPIIDFATSRWQRRYGLPRDAPFVMFTAARTAGWLAHAMEQALSGQLIRPRARYSGPPLEAL